MQLQHIIENHWYRKTNFLLSIILLPLSAIFFMISRIRYYFYKYGIYKKYSLPVPVVIVGNITVGGVGKTPLTKMIALELMEQGIDVGIIMRGYKSSSNISQVVYRDSNSKIVGDEALIYAQSGIKVAIGRDRYSAGITLLKKYPNIQIILSDDGLQHYRLKRDFEIAVVDSTRGFGNGRLLPMGPLRETIKRVKKVNAIVLNGSKSRLQHLTQYKNKIYEQRIVLDKIYNPVTHETANHDYFKNKNITVMAAIGNPRRFVDLLNSLSIQINNTKFFIDHYHYKENDIPENGLILVTEKDYTKLKQFNNPRIWVVSVRATLNSNKLVDDIKLLISRSK